MNPYSIPTLISFILSLFLVLFILYHGRQYLVNKVLSLAIASVGIMEFGNFMALNSLYSQKLLFWVKISLVGCCLIPASWSLFSLIFAKDPNEKITKKSKINLLIISTFSLFFLVFVHSDLFITLPQLQLHEKIIILLGRIGYFFCIFLLLAIVFILINLENIYRNSTGAKKWQIKYSIVAMFAAFTFYIYVISRVLLFRFVDLVYIPIGSVVILICLGLLTFSFIRHRLMNVDVFISRQVAYGSFTIVIISSYLILVGLIGELLKRLNMDFNKVFYPVLVLLSLLALSTLGLSAKNRKKFTRFIDRHFYKNRYDYRKEWIGLTNVISSAPGLNNLLIKFMDLLAETMCVNDVSVWLYDDEDKRYKLSAAREVPISGMPIDKDAPLIKRIKEESKPFPVLSNASDGDKAKFDHTDDTLLDGHRVSVISPLMVKDQLVGFITLGREITGAVYNYEDYDMLKTMCHHAANAIMNVRLSERLVLAGEMEIMNKISSFVLHDMKNSVSMLSLIVQNASLNMDKPDFQKDLLDTIAKTIENMKGLMARLTRLPKEIVLNKSKTDVNGLLMEGIKRTGLGKDGIELAEDYADLPKVNIDRERIQGVLDNIIINAQESLKSKGKVSISTYLEDMNIVIDIKDDGSGMSEEFIRNRLFKPFQTTKKKGLGIGLYQCKMIIAAHGGGIKVESAEGKGALFRINLPLEK